ncbi:uncharacterized protein ASCRUDRAFT_69514 [Ascoidea rubescens DSM 1968]|uniref:Zn(2)-C6 fungal-type domain-containing protein n=1 Tax=Ascoidea rubescens DSM 1968 TaxID=1344418 RepID=A0A1D2VJT9_9ASCO|nr:hypothetical protein ASCRUDRAFT_69514 [Ascoidea rubescens DSM 1968]ODV61777.1 hypothetical protein ASCRUDRAFT_69514 [Ascoidea rubescens DSM 1968]
MNQLDSKAPHLPPVKKRRRNTSACSNCRKKKRKCDRQRPSCSLCIKNNTICIYQEPTWILDTKKVETATNSNLLANNNNNFNGNAQTGDTIFRKAAATRLDDSSSSNQADHDYYHNSENHNQKDSKPPAYFLAATQPIGLIDLSKSHSNQIKIEDNINSHLKNQITHIHNSNSIDGENNHKNNNQHTNIHSNNGSNNNQQNKKFRYFMPNLKFNDKINENQLLSTTDASNKNLNKKDDTNNINHKNHKNHKNDTSSINNQFFSLFEKYLPVYSKSFKIIKMGPFHWYIYIQRDYYLRLLYSSVLKVKTASSYFKAKLGLSTNNNNNNSNNCYTKIDTKMSNIIKRKKFIANTNLNLSSNFHLTLPSNLPLNPSSSTKLNSNDTDILSIVNQFLPEKKIVLEYVDIFFRNVYPFFPFIDESSFRSSIINIYNNSPKKNLLNYSNKRDSFSVAILLLVLRLAYLSAFFTNLYNENNSLYEIDQYALTLVKLILNNYNYLKKSSLEIFQIILLMRLYKSFAPEGCDSLEGYDTNILNSLLNSTALSIGLNRDISLFYHVLTYNKPCLEFENINKPNENLNDNINIVAQKVQAESICPMKPGQLLNQQTSLFKLSWLWSKLWLELKDLDFIHSTTFGERLKLFNQFDDNPLPNFEKFVENSNAADLNIEKVSVQWLIKKDELNIVLSDLIEMTLTPGVKKKYFDGKKVVTSHSNAPNGVDICLLYFKIKQVENYINDNFENSKSLIERFKSLKEENSLPINNVLAISKILELKLYLRGLIYIFHLKYCLYLHFENYLSSSSYEFLKDSVITHSEIISLIKFWSLNSEEYLGSNNSFSWFLTPVLCSAAEQSIQFAFSILVKILDFEYSLNEINQNKVDLNEFSSKNTLGELVMMQKRLKKLFDILLNTNKFIFTKFKKASDNYYFSWKWRISLETALKALESDSFGGEFNLRKLLTKEQIQKKRNSIFDCDLKKISELIEILKIDDNHKDILGIGDFEVNETKDKSKLLSPSSRSISSVNLLKFNSTTFISPSIQINNSNINIGSVRDNKNIVNNLIVNSDTISESSLSNPSTKNHNPDINELNPFVNFNNSEYGDINFANDLELSEDLIKILFPDDNTELEDPSMMFSSNFPF